MVRNSTKHLCSAPHAVRFVNQLAWPPCDRLCRMSGYVGSPLDLAHVMPPRKVLQEVNRLESCTSSTLGVGQPRSIQWIQLLKTKVLLPTRLFGTQLTLDGPSPELSPKHILMK